MERPDVSGWVQITSAPQRRFLRSKSKGAISKHASVAHRSAIENTLSFFSACLAGSAFSRYECVTGASYPRYIESRYRWWVGRLDGAKPDIVPPIGLDQARKLGHGPSYPDDA